MLLLHVLLVTGFMAPWLSSDSLSDSQYLPCAGLVCMISLWVGELEAPQEGAVVTPYWTLEKLIAFLLNGMREGLLCSIQSG